MNQFVPQLLVGDVLYGSSGPPSYRPEWKSGLATWTFGSHYFFEIRDEATEAPTAAASRHELEVDIQSAIDRLSPKMRTIVVLRYLQSLSYEEIAETLQISLGTVKSRLSRAHAALDRELTPVVDRHFIERNPAL